MKKDVIGEITEVDDWKRYMCTKMPMADDTTCITADGYFNRCNKCRYHVENTVRRV